MPASVHNRRPQNRVRGGESTRVTPPRTSGGEGVRVTPRVHGGEGVRVTPRVTGGEGVRVTPRVRGGEGSRGNYSWYTDTGFSRVGGGE